ncbi:hypothetical protein B0T16DRAFT_408090 [Cercophora newfieldiana]|uniref:Uncharacterized protein n=1 Tax=Cercophora newfieldiana TaxID=92897 RepID=A0AA39YAH8_9PEZI|nr:hypothetical protein B0T16DRAFT_408090 [Cercophora newfieldiana]
MGQTLSVYRTADQAVGNPSSRMQLTDVDRDGATFPDLLSNSSNRSLEDDGPSFRPTKRPKSEALSSVADSENMEGNQPQPRISAPPKKPRRSARIPEMGRFKAVVPAPAKSARASRVAKVASVAKTARAAKANEVAVGAKAAETDIVEDVIVVAAEPIRIHTNTQAPVLNRSSKAPSLSFMLNEVPHTPEDVRDSHKADYKRFVSRNLSSSLLISSRYARGGAVDVESGSVISHNAEYREFIAGLPSLSLDGKAMPGVRASAAETQPTAGAPNVLGRYTDEEMDVAQLLLDLSRFGCEAGSSASPIPDADKSCSHPDCAVVGCPAPVCRLSAALKRKR